jgi:recombinational DNA repair protein RecR
MKIHSFLLLLPSVAFTEAFVTRVPLPTLRKEATATTSSGGSTVILRSNQNEANDDDILDRLQHEYKALQEKLALDIVKHDEVDAEKVEEEMIEKLTEATKIHEHKQMEIIHDAESICADAQKTRKLAEDLKRAERGENPEMVNEMEAAYEDLVRYSDYKELEAIDKKEAARLLYHELQENENRLKETLEALKGEATKNAAMEEKIHAQHRSFLDDVKGAILAHPDIMISLDPHIL